MADEKKMTVFQLTVMTTVNMIGSGVIMLPSKLAEVGTMSVLSWLVTLTGALCLAYVFARCGMLTDNTQNGMGGYAEYAFGRSGNMMANFTYAISLMLANTAMAVSIVGYGEMALGIRLKPTQVAISAMMVLAISMVANFFGSHYTGMISSITVWGVIIPVLFLCTAGWFWFSPHTYVQAWNPHQMGFFKGISVSIPITLWAFLGLESAVANSDSVNDPKRNVPIAIIGGTIAAGTIYIASTNLIQGIVNNGSIVKSTAPFGTAFTYMFNSRIGVLVMVLLTLSCWGSLLTWQFTLAEVFRSSAKAGYFPKIFERRNRFGAPVWGMLIILAGQLLLSLMTISPNLNAQFNDLVDLAVVTNLIPYILSMGAARQLQLSAGLSSSSPNFKVTNFLALLAGIYSIYSMYSCGLLSLDLGAGVIFIGWLVYGLMPHEAAQD